MEPNATTILIGACRMSLILIHTSTRTLIHATSKAVGKNSSLDEHRTGLVEVGHIHDEYLQVIWVKPSFEDSKCSLSFFVESDGNWDTVKPESDTFVGEAFFELKPLGKLSFSKQDNDYSATLSEETIGYHQTTIVIPALAINGNTFDLKFQLPSHAEDRP